MKQGTIIYCESEEHMRLMLIDLGCMGFHAVRDSGAGYNLRITDVPEPEYRVLACDEDGRYQTICCWNLEEAQACCIEMKALYGNAEILKGYPGEWETI